MIGSLQVLMTKKSTKSDDGQAPELTPEAERALAEAAERRALQAEDAARDPEKGGPKGAEPTRFGDWERKGIAYDF